MSSEAAPTSESLHLAFSKIHERSSTDAKAPSTSFDEEPAIRRLFPDAIVDLVCDYLEVAIQVAVGKKLGTFAFRVDSQPRTNAAFAPPPLSCKWRQVDRRGRSWWPRTDRWWGHDGYVDHTRSQVDSRIYSIAPHDGTQYAVYSWSNANIASAPERVCLFDAKAYFAPHGCMGDNQGKTDPVRTFMAGRDGGSDVLWLLAGAGYRLRNGVIVDSFYTLSAYHVGHKTWTDVCIHGSIYPRLWRLDQHTVGLSLGASTGDHVGSLLPLHHANLAKMSASPFLNAGVGWGFGPRDLPKLDVLFTAETATLSTTTTSATATTSVKTVPAPTQLNSWPVMSESFFTLADGSTVFVRLPVATYLHSELYLSRPGETAFARVASGWEPPTFRAPIPKCDEACPYAARLAQEQKREWHINFHESGCARVYYDAVSQLVLIMSTSRIWAAFLTPESFQVAHAPTLHAPTLHAPTLHASTPTAILSLKLDWRDVPLPHNLLSRRAKRRGDPRNYLHHHVRIHRSASIPAPLRLAQWL